jgi:Fur family transcriptional regulator, zinc uptake regulator
MTQPSHNHAKCLDDAVQKAEMLCNDVGARLTPIRKRVLELVWGSHKAVKAYDILQQLDTKDGALAPPTVYRALDFLLEHGLVHKIESLNGFVGCTHPLNKHGCQFLICKKCGDVKEFCDDEVSKLIKQNTKQAGFIFSQHMLEVYGTCAYCAGS